MEVDELYETHYQDSNNLAEHAIMELLQLCDKTKLTALSPASQRCILDTMVSRSDLDYEVLDVLVNENNVNDLYNTVDGYLETYEDDPEMLDPFLPGKFLLEDAINNGRSDIVDLLLRKGANVNATHTYIDGSNDIMYTHLIRAVSLSNIDIVTTLLYAGADPRIYTIENTPISSAIERGHYEYIDLLIAHGADLNHLIETDDGIMVNPILAELVTPHLAELVTPHPLTQSSVTPYDLCLRLIDNGLVLGNDRDYPYIAKVLNSYMLEDVKFKWVYLLLSYCYDPNLGDKKSFTNYYKPLVLAKRYGMAKIQKLLELYGARE